jgi:hypothetical protein
MCIIGDMMLEELYKQLQEDPDRIPDLYTPPSYVYFVKRALDQKFGRVFDYKEVEKLMYEEGMLRAGAYGIPSWYILKYGN